MSETTLDVQIACVLREIAMRKHVYPRLVRQLKITSDGAEKEIKTMEAVYRTLLTVKELGGVGQFLGEQPRRRYGRKTITNNG